MSSQTNLSYSSLLERLYSAEVKLAAAFEIFHLKIRLCPDSLKAKMPRFSEVRLLRATENLELTTRVLLECAELKVDPREDAKFFMLTMRALGAKYSPDFEDYLEPNHIVEAYDLENFQVFRNFRFMELCSYSLAEVLAYEWFELFERPKRINERLLQYASSEIWQTNRTIALDVPAHHLRECQGEQQTIRCKFKHGTPLFSGPEKPFGVVATLEATVLSEVGSLGFL